LAYFEQQVEEHDDDDFKDILKEIDEREDMKPAF
jgi:hypothetical protein